MTEPFPIPFLGFVAFSGTGKTTLLTRLIPELKLLSLRCAVIKHSHHDFSVDIPGKDSHRLSEAGAEQVLLEGFRQTAIAKIEVHRPSRGTPLICRHDPNVIALACDVPPDEQVQLPLLALNEPGDVAAFVAAWLQRVRVD